MDHGARETAAEQFPHLRARDYEGLIRVRIEFEYESRNFLTHMHSTSECDLIVCWSHNWLDCPMEVIELKSLVGKLGLGIEQKVILPEKQNP